MSLLVGKLQQVIITTTTTTTTTRNHCLKIRGHSLKTEVRQNSSDIECFQSTLPEGVVNLNSFMKVDGFLMEGVKDYCRQR